MRSRYGWVAVLLVLAVASGAAAQARRPDSLLGYGTHLEPGTVCRAAGGSWTPRARGGVCSVTPAPIGGVSGRTEVETCTTGDICRVEMIVNGASVDGAFSSIHRELERRHGPGRSTVAPHTVAAAMQRCQQSPRASMLFGSRYADGPLTVEQLVHCRSTGLELRLRYRVAEESGSGGPRRLPRPPITPLD